MVSWSGVDFDCLQQAYDEGNTRYALELAVPALDLARSESSEYIAPLLDMLVSLCIDMCDLDSAKQYAIESVKIRETATPKTDRRSLATSYYNLGEVYRRSGNFEDAKHYTSEALETREDIFQGKNHPDLALSLNSSAAIYGEEGEYKYAKEIYDRTLEMWKSLYGETPNRYLATTLSDLGDLYESWKKLDEAVEKYKEAIDIFEKAFTLKPHDFLAACLSNLAGLYRKKKKWRDVEASYDRSISIREELFLNCNNFSLYQIYINFAGFCREQGQLTKSQRLFEKVLNLKNNIRIETEEEAIFHNNYAKLLQAQGKYGDSKTHYHKAIKLLEIDSEKNRDNLARFHNNLGEVYFEDRDFKKARLHYDRAEALSKGNADNNNFAQLISNKADLLFEQKKITEAEPLFERALEIRRKCFQDSPNNDLATSYYNLAKLYVVTDRLDLALKLMTGAIAIQSKWLYETFTYSVESQRILYVKQAQPMLARFLSMVCQFYRHDANALNAAFSAILQRKAIATEIAATFNYEMYGDRYPELREELDRLLSLNQELGMLSEKYEAEHQQKIDRLQRERDNLERDLVGKVPEIARDVRKFSIEAISEALPNQSLLIEFIQVDWCDFHASRTRKQKPRYLAFSMIQGQLESIRLNDLGSANSIDLAVDKLRMNFQDGRMDLQQLSSSNNLYRKLLAPIFKLYPSNSWQSLVIAPDGNLHLFPFHSLPIDRSGEKLLVDRYLIEYLSTGRDLLRRNNSATNKRASQPVIFADPDYDLDNVVEDTASDSKLSSLGEKFYRLDATREFARSLADKLEIAPRVDLEATANGVGESRSPRILTIATHGFALKPVLGWQEDRVNQDRLYDRNLDDPMQRSGLAFTGANRWRKGLDLPPEVGQGILFARDVSQLNLWSTELVVLVACSSGVGDIEIGEGVSGLRRAFTVAGCKKLIASLWDVPLQASILLMDKFFAEYLDGADSGLPSKCLLQAQEYVRSISIDELNHSSIGRSIVTELIEYRYLSGCEHPSTQPLKKPLFWAAWVCLG
jgi:tetratricopeptide (TPR) repeat protein